MGVRKIHNGDVFSRLTVIKAYSSRINKKNYSLCRCICGNEKEINNAMLQNGTTRSCGCFQREQCRINVCKHNKTHGQSYTRLYRIWKDLVYRGVGKVNKKYYAEKGIKICKEWLSFYNFFDWANTHGYNDTLSIDRIDNKKGYSPENCRWATAREQANNRSTNRFICYRNRTETMANWSRILKVSYARVKYRANHNLDLATGEAL
jgi:hypothetical protein